MGERKKKGQRQGITHQWWSLTLDNLAIYRSKSPSLLEDHYDEVMNYDIIENEDASPVQVGASPRKCIYN